MKRTTLSVTVLSLLFVTICITELSAQYGQRSLLERRVYYLADGKIASCDFWSIPLGKFSTTLRRYYPGFDTVEVTSNMNFSFLSSGYIEGNGYGDRGKVAAEAEFAIEEEGALKPIDINDIDYVYQSGSRVKLKNGADTDLFIHSEGNKFSASSMQIMIWAYDKVYKELKHSKDIPAIDAFSFTKEGAVRGLKAPRGDR